MFSSCKSYGVDESRRDLHKKLTRVRGSKVEEVGCGRNIDAVGLGDRSNSGTGGLVREGVLSSGGVFAATKKPAK